MAKPPILHEQLRDALQALRQQLVTISSRLDELLREREDIAYTDCHGERGERLGELDREIEKLEQQRADLVAEVQSAGIDVREIDIPVLGSDF